MLILSRQSGCPFDGILLVDLQYTSYPSAAAGESHHSWTLDGRGHAAGELETQSVSLAFFDVNTSPFFSAPITQERRSRSLVLRVVHHQLIVDVKPRSPTDCDAEFECPRAGGFVVGFERGLEEPLELWVAIVHQLEASLPRLHLVHCLARSRGMWFIVELDQTAWLPFMRYKWP